MSRFRGSVVLALIALATAVPVALAHGGGSQNYISEVKAVTPAVDGLRVVVLDRDDRLELSNRSPDSVVVEGYDGEPYVRLSPDGRVEVNRRSPALYLNEDRFANVDVPASADADASPEWRLQDNSGRFDWHDHRIHWMGKDRPEKVGDPDVRTTVFDWRVPVSVDGREGAVAGRLTWVPDRKDRFTVAAVLSLVGIAGAGALLVLVVRRRRRLPGDGPRQSEEAW